MPNPPLPPSWEPLWEDYEILRRASLSRHTVANYRDSLWQLAHFLGWPLSQPPSLEDLNRRQIAAFLEFVLATTSPSTAAMRYRGLAAVFNWLARPDLDGEALLAHNAMRGLKPPKTAEAPVPVLTLEEVRRLLASCRAKTDDPLAHFHGRRDEALIRFLYDTGCRRGEVGSMRVDPQWLNLREGTAMVTGKTGPRVVAFGAKTGAALYRYTRLRRRYAKPDQLALWVAAAGPPLSGNGIYQALKRRYEAAGVTAAKRAHIFRHTFSHEWRMAEGQLDDLVALNGWSSITMALRYGRSAAGERARAAHRRISPGDRL